MFSGTMRRLTVGDSLCRVFAANFVSLWQNSRQGDEDMDESDQHESIHSINTKDPSDDDVMTVKSEVGDELLALQTRLRFHQLSMIFLTYNIIPTTDTETSPVISADSISSSLFA